MQRVPKTKTHVAWTRVALGDVVERIVDRRDDPAGEGFHRFVGVEHIDSADLDLNRWATVTDADLPPTFRYVFPAGAVLFPTRRPALRKCAIANFRGVTGEKVLVLTTKDPTKLLPALLPYILASPSVRQWVIDRAIGSVTPHFRWRDLAEFPLRIPPLAEQEKMAKALDSARDLLRKVRICAEHALTLRTSAQRHLLLRESAADGNCPLDDVANLNPSDPPLSDTDPFLSMDGVREWHRNPARFEVKGHRGGVRARAGDVLMARITPCLENGKIAQVPENIPRCGGSTEFIVFRPKTGTDRSYLYWLVASDGVRNAAVGRLSGTTGRQRVSASDLRDVRVPRLSSSEQAEFGATLDKIETLRAVLHERVEATDIVFRNLMECTVGPLTA